MVLGVLVALCLPQGATAAMTRSQLRAEGRRADAYAQGQADARNAIVYRQSRRPHNGRRVYVYFVVWSPGNGTVCTFDPGRAVRVVLYDSGALRPYDWNSTPTCWQLSTS